MRTVLTLMIVLLALPATAQAPTAPSGSWAFSGNKSEVAKVQTMVDAIVDDLSFVIRPVARPRLKKVAAPWDKLSIKQDGQQVTVTRDDETMSSAMGKGKKLKNDAVLTFTMKGSSLVETIKGKDGGRTNVYQPTDSGLTVNSVVTSPRLPRPMKFSYTYR